MYTDEDREGPFAGLYNGDRRYLVDFTNGRNMGSFHLLDGEKSESISLDSGRHVADATRPAVSALAKVLPRFVIQKMALG